MGDDSYQGAGLSREHILHQIDESLRRMKTDYVDFYELHRPDPETSLEESVTTMAGLVSCGKVRYWGFSNFETKEIQEMLTICDENSLPRPVISQPPYSWLQRDIEAEDLPICRENEIAVTPYRGLQSGLLTGKYRRGQPLPEDSRAAENPNWLQIQIDIYDKLEEFESEAEKAGLKPGQYAVRWLLDQPGIYSVVVGVKRIDQLADLQECCSF